MIVHILLDEKFINDYVMFVNQRFNKKGHLFLLMNAHGSIRYTGEYLNEDNLIVIQKNIKSIVFLMKELLGADKIILHGMFSRIMEILLGFSIFAKKTYWVLWGGDLYSYTTASSMTRIIKHRIIRKLKGITCELEDDYQLAKKWYGASCPYFPCMLYFSNVVQDNDSSSIKYEVSSKNDKVKKEKVFVLVGNSADPLNQHKKVLSQLVKYKSKIQLLLPLSYGDSCYANEISTYVNNLFDDDSIILLDFLPLSEYMELLKKVDVAVFAHERQQALGNTIQLIANGIKVYLDKTTTTYRWLESIGVKVFDSRDIHSSFLIPMSEEEKQSNIINIRKRTSKEALFQDWKRLFED